MQRFVQGAFAFIFALLVTGCATTPRATPDPLATPSALLHKARQKNSPGIYLDAARQSLSVATDATASTSTRAQATSLYDRAVAGCAVALFRSRPAAGATIKGSGTSYSLAFSPPPQADKLLIAENIERKHLKADYRRSGFGGSLVEVMNGPSTAGPNRPPAGYSIPVTAVADFGESSDGLVPVTIRFFDPRKVDDVRLAGKQRPLAGDFSAQLAYYPRINEFAFGVAAMMRSDLSTELSGLWFYEPYDPRKIPILFVHGLMSSPHVWLQVANELNADPEFRKRYQLWSYYYPTGAPIAVSALGLRTTLADAARRYRLKDNIILVGYSMGGILARMQVTNSGREIWDAVFRSKADSLYASLPADSVIKQALIFEADPRIARVVFIATPHRGCQFVTWRVVNVFASFIRLPRNLVNTFNNELADALRSVDPSIRSIPTGIRGLSPNSPLLLALDRLKITVPSHSIIGNLGKNNVPLAQSTDGVVPYSSTHLPQAESEVIVPAGHDAFKKPAAIAELRRILAL